jgi:hypothetical protein
VHLTTSGISELIVSIFLSSSVLIGMLTAAFRFGLRPLIADWAKLRAAPGTEVLQRRMAELEEEVRQLRMAANLQLPAESVRSGYPRT